MIDIMIAGVDKIFNPIFEIIDNMPEPPKKYEPQFCLHNIMCECEGQDCPGRTVPVKSYMRRLKKKFRKLEEA